MARELVKCDTPECQNKVWANLEWKAKKEYIFCKSCRNAHSYSVLVVQAKHEKPIKEIIFESRMFGSASYMADYIGVSFVTMYHWIKKYFGMTFQEFRRTHICKSDKCYLLNIRMSSYSRHDYILKKIRDRRYCACINALERDYIMTNAPIGVIPSILVGRPGIIKISDDTFAIAPSPIRFLNNLCPIYDLF